MRYKLTIRSLVMVMLALLMMTAAAAAVSAEETEGWVKKGKKVYYYLAGDEGAVKATGLQQIGSRYYFFSPKGVLQTGWVETEDGYRFFREKGKPGKLGRMYTGLKTIDGNLYCFDENGVVMTGFTRIGKRTYFFSAKGGPGRYGRAYINKWAKHEGEKYYFGPKGRMLKKRWVGDYYVGKDGKRLKNTVTPDGYQVNAKGKKVSDNKVDGWVKLDKKWYYFDLKKKKFLVSKFKKIDGERFYLDAEGVRVTGWQTIGKYIYYFSKDGVASTGATEIDGKNYYFNKKGRLQISKEVDGYTTDEEGVITSKPKNADLPKVLIVAGHGQGDPGVTSSLGMESAKTREFAALIYKNLKDSEIVDVSYYHNGSLSYDMYQRNGAALGNITSYSTGIKGNGKLKSTVKTRLKASSACAKLWEYDYVIEVHFNATGAAAKDISGNGYYKGFGIYINQYKSAKKRKIDTAMIDRKSVV